MDERAFYNEAPAKKPANLNCPSCRTMDTYEIGYLVRTKKDRIPGGADERDRARFAKAQSYMLLVETHAQCKNPRCRKRFEISGVNTVAFI